MTRYRTLVPFFSLFCLLGLLPPRVAGATEEGEKRPMTFMDILEMRSAGNLDFSHDGRWVLYTLSHIDWKGNKNFTDIWLTSAETGEARQLTFTEDKNERSPDWSPDGRFFGFLSDREGKKTQLYFMRTTGGEAWRVTNDKDGVSSFAFSEDGKWLAFAAGKPESRQLWLLSLAEGPEGTEPVKLTTHKTSVEIYRWAPDHKHIYFTVADEFDKVNQERNKKGFDVRVVDQPRSPRHLWLINLESKEEKRLTEGDEFTVASFELSDDGRWIVFRGGSTDRHASRFAASELYRLDRATGVVTRLTNNEVGEGQYEFSGDSQWLAFAAPNNFENSRQSEIYVMRADGEPDSWKMLTGDFDRAAGGIFWSLDGTRIYFNADQGVKSNLFSIPREGGTVTQLTHHNASFRVSFDEDARRLLIHYSDPHTPSDWYTADRDQLDDRNRWVRLTNANPQVGGFELADYEPVTWTSSDGREVEGILIYPIGYESGRRYPLIVQIHGGPAASYDFAFSGSYGTYTNVFAANGYAVFQPNYRGSSGYGEEFRMEIAGDYFRQAHDDIQLGVDALIERGIVDPDKMGFMGWSAGGHWSNWTLVTTDRFKAISTGAGAVNWISLYAQTDVQSTREFYFQGRPYDNWDHYLEVSPLKYINNAKTPTLIHFGERDQRIPMPQGLELHMALKKLGVPTEFLIYPGQPHGIRNRRYQMVKMQAEFAWFEKWIRGKEGWIDWQALLDTLKEEKDSEEGAEIED